MMAAEDGAAAPVPPGMPLAPGMPVAPGVMVGAGQRLRPSTPTSAETLSAISSLLMAKRQQQLINEPPLQTTVPIVPSAANIGEAIADVRVLQEAPNPIPMPSAQPGQKVVAVDAKSGESIEIASGARLAVDVEFGRGRTLYILSQGIWNEDFPGSAALPFTGALFRMESDGSVTEVVGSLNLPTSLEIVGKTAFIVSLTGDVWAIEMDNEPPYGVR